MPAIKAAPGSPEIIIVTGQDDPEGAALAIRSGAWDYIQKPLTPHRVTLPLTRALEYRAQKAAHRPRAVLKREAIVCGGPAMLTDALPRDEDGSLQAGSLAFFLDREKRIIATTSPDWRVGDVLPLEDGLLALAGGEQASSVIDLDGRRYLAGRAMTVKPDRMDPPTSTSPMATMLPVWKSMSRPTVRVSRTLMRPSPKST